MTEYFGQVIDGQIKKLNIRRGTVCGKNSPDSTYIANGYLPIVGTAPPYDSATQRLQGPRYVINGEQIDKVYTVVDIPQEELINTLIRACEQAVTALIQSEVTKYNEANGTVFGSVHSCANYATTDGYTHQPFCASVWAWNVAVWEKCREIQALGEMITVEELIAELPVYAGL